MYWWCFELDIESVIILDNVGDVLQKSTIHSTFCTDFVAVDWVNNDFYITDRRQQLVAYYDPDKSNYTVLYTTGTDSRPSGIAVDPGARCVLI